MPETVSSKSKTLTTSISDHRGQQKFVETDYQIEEYLVQQPAHIAAERSRDLQLLYVKKWNETHLEFNTVTLPTPVGFRTQFRTHQGLRRGPTGTELVENELQRQ